MITFEHTPTKNYTNLAAYNVCLLNFCTLIFIRSHYSIN